ncbi:hypothetical protein KC343_g10985 [Hortaea werneckii]|nr:hypothetical protein KC352_g32111 [Hortaea werneckii]KAI7534283.1 hypothetical protein KC317_g19003 [Hortaea werneckii]KAI7580654.1 hypothetical protein KC346_g18896 [Hortaea werneckii]KAI7613144.1 hypothetical protein KC343_g10985 [Hortaea werneckii]KAI7652176.1 hypothetical protein KC319_g10731 [Hortaea werneckii]
MEDNHKPKPKPNNADKQNNTTTTTNDETTQHQPSSHYPEDLAIQDQQEPPKVDDHASAETASDLPIINRRRPSEAETKLLREYGGKENLREKTKLAYNELDIDPGAETPQEEKSFAEGVVGEMDVEAQERRFHLGGYLEKKGGVKKGGSGK